MANKQIGKGSNAINQALKRIRTIIVMLVHIIILKLIRQSVFLDQNGEMLFQAMDQQESWISCGKLWNLAGGNLVRVLSEIWSSFVPSIFLKLPTWATLQLGEEKSSQQSRCKSHFTAPFDFVSFSVQGLMQHQLKPCYANKNPTGDYFHWTQVWSKSFLEQGKLTFLSG